MTDASTKEAQFKKHLSSLLHDMKEGGSADGQAMAVLGAMAGGIAQTLGQPSWSAAKSAMTAELYRALLEAFDLKGNEHHKAGRVKQAYAIQAMAISLVAWSRHADPQIAEGEALLDAIIDHVADIHSKTRH